MIASRAVAPGPDAVPETDRLGLCASCRHGETIGSSRGAEFLRCRLSRIDASFPKYPRIPVLACTGFAPDAAPPTVPSTDGT
jgi:hypothetical protein